MLAVWAVGGVALKTAKTLGISSVRRAVAVAHLLAPLLRRVVRRRLPT